MAGFGTKYITFLVVFHALLFFAQGQGLIPAQTGQNPNQAFLNNVSSEELEGTVAGANESGIFLEDFQVAFESLEGIDALAGILTSPYDIASSDDIPIPNILALIFVVMLDLYGVIAILSFLRGVPF